MSDPYIAERMKDIYLTKANLGMGGVYASGVYAGDCGGAMNNALRSTSPWIRFLANYSETYKIPYNEIIMQMAHDQGFKTAVYQAYCDYIDSLPANQRPRKSVCLDKVQPIARQSAGRKSTRGNCTKPCPQGKVCSVVHRLKPRPKRYERCIASRVGAVAPVVRAARVSRRNEPCTKPCPANKRCSVVHRLKPRPIRYERCIAGEESIYDDIY